MFIEENKDDGKGKYQSHECYITGEFTATQVNCRIDISIFGANEQEILENKLITIDKLLQDLLFYKQDLLIYRNKLNNAKQILEINNEC